MSIPKRLARARAESGLRRCQVAQRAGISAASVSRWESGSRSPLLRHACTWAAVLDHRIVVTRDGHHLGDVLSLLPDLGDLRRSADLSQAEMARRMYLARNSVCQLELSAHAAVCQLVTVERYLTGCGYRLDLEATPMAVAA